MNKSQIKIELAKRELARRNFKYYINYTFDKYIWSKWNEGLAHVLQRIEEGKIKFFMLEVSPRWGKTELVAKKFPAYLLGKHPEKKILTTGYSSDLAAESSRHCKQSVLRQDFKDVFPNFQVSDEKREAANWETSKRGGYYATGIGGAVTGKGFDCIPTGTMISTEEGEMRIEDLAFLSNPCKVLAYDERRKKIVSKKTKAVGMRKETWIYRITTKKGRVVKATGEHPFFTGNEYKKANTLSPGDNLLCVLRKRKNNTGVRYEQGDKKKIKKSILFNALCKYLCKSRTSRDSNLQVLRKKNSKNGKWKILFGCLQKSVEKNIFCTSEKEKEPRKSLFSLWKKIRFSEKHPILFERMCRQSSQHKNDGGEQSNMERWSFKKEDVIKQFTGNKKIKTINFKEGFSFVRRLQKEKGSTRSPHRFKSIKYCARKLSYALSELSSKITRNGESTETDTVEMVERICEESVVFNLSVEDCENFFANGILTHNCGIIDDFVKDRAAAESPTVRESTWKWYTSTFLTRDEESMQKDTSIIVFATRWHVDDLAGKILKSSKEAGKEIVYLDLSVSLEEIKNQVDSICGKKNVILVLKVPAINEKEESNFPERFSTEQLLIKRDIDNKNSMEDWHALYMQDPILAGSGDFTADMFRYFALSDLDAIKNEFEVGISCDPAFSTRQSADSLVVIAQARHRKSGEIYEIDRMSGNFPPSIGCTLPVNMAMKWKSAGWNVVFISVEDVSINRTQQLFVNNVDEEMRKQKCFVSLIRYHPKNKKEDRIRYRLEPYFARGAYYFRIDDAGNDAWRIGEEEYLRFPTGAHDDHPDCATIGVITFEEFAKTRTDDIVEQQEELINQLRYEDEY